MTETKHTTNESDILLWAATKLIAAAPETAAERDRLREVNRKLVEALVALVDADTDRKATWITRDAAIADARAALARAKGE